MIDIISERRYGQLRMTKPAELKGAAPQYTYKYLGKATAQVFVRGADIWIRHPDWCSKVLYGRDLHRRKFIYNDTFGAVVLRGHAWIRLTRVLSYDDPSEAIRQIMQECLSDEDSRFNNDDYRMFVDLYTKVIKSRLSGNSTHLSF